MCVEDTVHCKDGCSALQERLQCTASEMGKRDTEIVSPIQDKRKGKKTVAFLTAKFTSKTSCKRRLVSDGYEPMKTNPRPAFRLSGDSFIICL